jgi:hypothetical protein
MVLSQFVAQKRLRLLDELKSGQPPSEGRFDAALLAEGRMKGQPQLGTTRFSPTRIVFEIIFPDPKSTATVMPVEIDAPERIVFMPVPSWVVETIWQGDIDGSYHFESDAMRLMGELTAQLQPGANDALFGRKQPTRRE